MYDLKPGLYDVSVKTGGGCGGGLAEREAQVSVRAFGGNVTGLLIRASGSNLGVVELSGKEEPKKLNGGNSKVSSNFYI